MNSNKDYAAALWDRAEECRAIAANLHDSELKAEFLKLADPYLSTGCAGRKDPSSRGRVT